MENLAVSGTGVSGVTTMVGSIQGVAQVVTPVSGLPQVWYNCGPDGVGQLLTTTNGQPIQVELATPEMARQFNQHVQTPYGNIQVQVQSAPQNQTELKPLVETPVEKPKSRSRSAGERVACPTCGKTVSCNATLRDHMRTHTGERPFTCAECGLAFAQRSNLRMHKRLHTGERPYMCGLCGKTFARSSHLPAHMRTHTGEKPFECDVCLHSFITSQQLKNHYRVHTGEKPWKCDQCSAAFTHSSSLSTHKKKHSGTKPYACEKCQKRFFFSSALDKHMKVHSKERPFTCTTCQKAFKYKESLTVHMEKYCGKECVSKKVRGPRKVDAQKPGPKPGGGRKYVQQRKGRPRGRPRRRGRWSSRVTTRRNYRAMEEMEEEDWDESEKEDESSVKKEAKTDESEIEKEGDEEEHIPTAELKVEVIQPGDTISLEDFGEIPDHHTMQQANPQQLPTNVIQINGDIPIDGNTTFAVVSADGSEQQVTSGVQVLTLPQGFQLVPTDGEEVQIPSHYVTRDLNNVQVWCPRNGYDSV